MRIGIIAKAKQGDIMEALDKRGWTQGQGAEFLGMSANTFSKLINLKWVPREFSAELTIKLYELTGKAPEELFPDWARQKDFLAMPKISKRLIEATPLILQCVGPQFLLMGPEEAFCSQEVAGLISEVLRTLSPREENIIREIFVDGESAEEIAARHQTTAERVKSVRDLALRKLRRPENARILAECFAEIPS